MIPSLGFSCWVLGSYCILLAVVVLGKKVPDGFAAQGFRLSKVLLGFHLIAGLVGGRWGRWGRRGNRGRWGRWGRPGG